VERVVGEAAMRRGAGDGEGEAGKEGLSGVVAASARSLRQAGAQGGVPVCGLVGGRNAACERGRVLMKVVLVAYATQYGSTREVAQAVASILSESGVEVDVQPATEVTDLSGYAAVVLGGALYFFRLHKHARRFLARHRKALRQTPLAVFAMGPFNDTEEEFASARRQLDKALMKRELPTLVSVQVFGGRFDPAKLRFPHSNPAMKSTPASDVRNWDVIRAWAASLPELLRLEEGNGTP